MRRRELLTLPVTFAPGRTTHAQAGPIAVASFSILGDMARAIAGGGTDVRVVVGPEVDAHGFEPRPSDLLAVRGARLLIRNGLGFDPWFDRVQRAAAGGATLVTATEGIVPRPDPRGRAADPHAWQDLGHGAAYVRAILRGLVAADPAHAAEYEANAAGYTQRLAMLDAWVRAELATVPAARRVVVTSHDAFGYFAAAYGVRFLAPQGAASLSDPSAAAVAGLLRLIRAEGVTAVFLDSRASPATLQRLATEAGVRVRGRLYADSLSAPDGPAPTYEAMFRHNLGLLVPAMRGDT